MKTQVFVVTHKEFDDSILPKDGAYSVIKVGDSLSDHSAKEKGYYVDSEGCSISAMNPYYCELTAYYWVWKNVKDVDITGINHYRRYFFDYNKDADSLFDDIVRKDRIESILSQKKAIMSFYSIKEKGINYFKKNERMKEDWAIIERIICKYYPKMKKTFYQCMHSRLTVYGNMIIAYKTDFDHYCEFLFDVLKKYDIAKKKLGQERRLRVDGYISENLLWIWANYYYKKGEVYHLEIRNTEDDRLGHIEYKGTFLGKCIRFIKQNRLLLVIYRRISLLYLYLTR